MKGEREGHVGRQTDRQTDNETDRDKRSAKQKGVNERRMNAENRFKTSIKNKNNSIRQ